MECARCGMPIVTLQSAKSDKQRDSFIDSLLQKIALDFLNKNLPSKNIEALKQHVQDVYDSIKNETGQTNAWLARNRWILSIQVAVSAMANNPRRPDYAAGIKLAQHDIDNMLFQLRSHEPAPLEPLPPPYVPPSSPADEIPYKVLCNNTEQNLEVREYEPFKVARTSIVKGRQNQAFKILARYIGVLNSKHPRNNVGRSIPMMKPVLIYTSDGHEPCMEFVMKLTWKNDAIPLREDPIQLDDVPKSLYAVIPYKSSYADKKGILDTAKIAQVHAEALQRLEYKMDTSRPCKKAVYSMPFFGFFFNAKVWIPVLPVQS